MYINQYNTFSFIFILMSYYNVSSKLETTDLIILSLFTESLFIISFIFYIDLPNLCALIDDWRICDDLIDCDIM